MGIYEELAMRLRTEDVILSTRRLDDGTFEEWLGEGGEQVSRLAYPPHLVLFGGGHIAQALTPMAKACGIRATVVDDRAEVLTYDHFPQGTELIHSLFTELPEQRLERIAKPYYCIFTHGHSADAECLSWAGTRKSAYIGMIGSRRKIEACKEVAHARGVAEEVLSTIHSPIGLAINAVSPAEIAVAIMAEIISVYRKDGDVWTLRSSNTGLPDGVRAELSRSFDRTMAQQAAEQGYIDAFRTVGRMSELGKGCAASPETAVGWYQRAVEMGDVFAYAFLADMYERGAGTEKNFEEAVRLYKLGVKNGSEMAMERLALMYLDGRGVSQDTENPRETARKLLYLAKEFGSKKAPLMIQAFNLD